MTTRTASRPDLYSRVTAQIVADLENGVRPWTKPWGINGAGSTATRPLRHNGAPYAGINVVTLWSAALAAGYASPVWMTFRQALELGAHVRKGEKGSLVVFASKLTRTESDESTGEESERRIPFLKGYTVFNAGQIDGLPDRYRARPAPRFDPPARIAHAESFFAATGAAIRHGGNRAFYCPGSDHIQMPPFEAFRDAESYYATLAHEATHWTGAPRRCDRAFGKRFGDHAYAAEELVAELGAAFLCADLELTLEDRTDHASYIASWLEVLKSDKRAIFTAAAQAQRAADFLHALQPADSREEAEAAHA